MKEALSKLITQGCVFGGGCVIRIPSIHEGFRASFFLAPHLAPQTEKCVSPALIVFRDLMSSRISVSRELLQESAKSVHSSHLRPCLRK